MQAKNLTERKATALQRLHTWLASNGATPAALAALASPRLSPPLRELAMLECLAGMLEEPPAATPTAPSTLSNAPRGRR